MRRHGLVIGNNRYAFDPLDNAVNDAQLIHSILQTRGFKSRLIVDATREDIANAVADIKTVLRPGDLFFFFFAGHAIEHMGYGYLFPVDMPEATPGAIDYFGYPVQALLEETRYSETTRIVVLDACRNAVDLSRIDARPFIEKLHEQRSEAEASQRDLLLAYSTSYGAKALDGADSNSLFTQVLAELLPRHDLTVESLFKEVGHRVVTESRLLQRPWFYSSLETHVKISDLPEYTFFHSFVAPTKGSDFALGGARDHSATFLVGNSAVIYRLQGSEPTRFGELKRGVRAAASSNNGTHVFLSASGGIYSESWSVAVDVSPLNPINLTVSRDGRYIVVFGHAAYAAFEIVGRTPQRIQLKAKKVPFIYCAEFVSDHECWLSGANGVLTKLTFREHQLNVKTVRLPFYQHVYSISTLGSDRAVLTTSSGGVHLMRTKTAKLLGSINLGKSVRKPYSRRESILAISDDEVVQHFLFAPHNLDNEVITSLGEHLLSNDLMYSAISHDGRILAIGSTEGIIYMIDTRNWDNYHSIDVGGGRRTELTGLQFNQTGDLLTATRDDSVFCYTPAQRYPAALAYVDNVITGGATNALNLALQCQRERPVMTASKGSLSLARSRLTRSTLSCAISDNVRECTDRKFNFRLSIRQRSNAI